MLTPANRDALSTFSPTGRTAWLVVGLLMPVALLNYLDRQMLASMKSSVMADLPDVASDANWGFMLGQFKWVYAFLSPVGGYVADRYGRRATICASLFVWSAVTWHTGHVTTYTDLLWTRTLMGFSEAFYIPAALALIADHHAGPTRSRAVGLHQIAIYLGVIAGGFGGYAADDPAIRWRRAFDACGLLGMAYAVPLAFLLRARPGPLPVTPAAATAAIVTTSEPTEPAASPVPLDYAPPADDQPSPWRAAAELLANPSFLLMLAYFTVPALAAWVVRDWMPAILKKQFGIGQGHAGVAATLYWQSAAIVGAVAGGWLADRWARRSDRGRLYVSGLSMALLAPAIFGVGMAGTLSAAIGFLVLFGLGWGVFDANNMPILSQVVRPHLRATGYGLMNLVSISAGGLADWGFGALQDRRVPLAATFGVFAAGAAVSAGLVLLIRPRATGSEGS